ncbi:MAG: PQQ-binding-like beta-propeller repeat protein [Anaerolineae bacterium]|nr:PQQ-binding-like beta-propeller repeat protein [Gemmatimonadaceae bacterium]
MKRRVPRDGVNDVRGYSSVASDVDPLPDANTTDPRVAWRAFAGRGTVGAPAIGDRVIAIATIDRWVYALDTRTGQTYWRHRGEAPFGTGPLMADGRIYAATEGRAGALIALNLYNGKRRWRTGVGDVASALVLQDGVVYGATHIDGRAFAVNATTGKMLWSRAIGPSLSGPLLTRDGRVVVTTLTDTLFVMNAGTGSVLNRFPLTEATTAAIAVLNDTAIILASPSGRVTAITLGSKNADAGRLQDRQRDSLQPAPGLPRLLWSVPTTSPVLGAPIVWRDTVFALTAACDFWAIPVAAPATARQLKLACNTVAGPTLVRGGVLVATVRGEVALFDRQTGARLWERQIGSELRHPPVVRNSQIIVAPILGNIVSLR